MAAFIFPVDTHGMFYRGYLRFVTQMEYNKEYMRQPSGNSGSFKKIVFKQTQVRANIFFTEFIAKLDTIINYFNHRLVKEY